MKMIYTKYRRELSTLAALILAIILFSILNNSYLSVSNQVTIIQQAVTYGLMGIGMTLVILTGGIDLSVGSGLAFVACVAAQLAKAGMPIWIWMPLCLLIGFGMGLVNGFLITKMHLQPFVATMGTMSVYRGLAYIITGGFPVLGVPQAYRQPLNAKIGATLTVSVLYFIIFALIIAVMMRKTRLGAHTYAIGGNEEAARLSGVKTDRCKILMYAFCMLGTALAALVMVGRLGTGDPSTGQGYEMEAIAAAAIGGTSMTGGRGHVFGTVIGAILFSALKVGLIVLRIDTFYQFVVTGLVIVLAAYIDILQGRLLVERRGSSVKFKVADAEAKK
ncbi:MAG: ABC transporter permease [Eubacteriales bacterium]|nr:ABC transporter permease [Eubacteriales bacterium]